jgi:MFS family permease
MFTRLLDRSRAGLVHTFHGHSDELVDEHNYRNLLINGALFGLVDGGIFNFLPVFLARLNASPTVVGLLTSGPSLLGILTYIPGGAYAERHTDLVRLATRASLVTRLTYPMIALLPILWPPAHVPMAAVVIWALTAIPNAVLIPAWTAVMQKAVSPVKRAQLNGTRWALMSVVSAIAIALFGHLLDHIPFPGGYQIVFLISFVSALINLYFWSQVRVPPFVSERAGDAAGRSLAARLHAFFRPFAESRPFVRYNLATVAYRLFMTMPAALFSIFWVQDLHATNTWIGLRGTAGYAALVVGYRFWGKTANHVGHRTLLLICGVGLGIYPVLTALAPTMEWLLPAALLWGFTIAGTDLGFFDMLLAACPDGRQPSFTAASNMLVSVATTVGPLLGAVLADGLGTRSALLVIGILQVASAAFFLLLPGREQEGLGAADGNG